MTSSSTDRVVVVIGPVTANLDLVLRREGLIAGIVTSVSTTYCSPSPSSPEENHHDLH